MTRIEQLEQKVKRLEQKICCKTQFFDTIDDLPTEGSTGVIYVTDDGNIYVWNGSEYVLNGLGDVYYTNSYVERLKALGSDVQYSNYIGNTIGNGVLSDGRIYITSFFINKASTIFNVGWKVGSTQGNYTADEYNGIGIYSMDIITGNITLLGKTTNDGTIWQSITATNYNNRDFENPIILNKGIYFIAYIYNSSAQVTAPTVATAPSTEAAILTNMATLNVPTNTYLAGYIDGQIELPLEILSINVTKSATSQGQLLYYLS